jgi:hypothetical protein
MALCGRDDLAWDELARAGLEFLLERSRGYMSTTRRSGQHERLRSLGGAWLSARPLLSQ